MASTSWLAFSIDRNTKTPIFEQICQAIREQAITGEIVEGTRLPPTRSFATELGVSRSTVVTAYEQLVAEGYAQGVQGSGYVLCATGEVELQDKAKTADVGAAPTAARTPVPFEAGEPDMRLFPYRQWAKSIAKVCRTNPQSMLNGADRFGNFELRKAIADHVHDWRGITASPHQIIVTAGSSDALEMCMRTLATTGDRIGLEDPCYLPLKHFASAQGLHPVFLSVDDNGANLPSTPDRPKLVVLTPSHQYPLGGAMTPARRLDFIRWAKDTDGWIIEDDYDSEFRYAGRPIPALAGFDRLDRTIYVGSFSKIFSNTLRLGYLIIPEELMEAFSKTLRSFGVKASLMPQQALAEFMASGEFYRHLRRVRRVYGDRRSVLIKHLAEELKCFGTFKDHQAGMQIAFHLTAEINDTELVSAAVDKGLSLRALSTFSARKNGLNGVLLGFCGYTEEELSKAFSTLHSVLTDLTASPEV